GKAGHACVDAVPRQFDEGHASGGEVGGGDEIAIRTRDQPVRRELQTDGDLTAIRQVDDGHAWRNPIDGRNFPSSLGNDDLLGNDAKIERAHYSIALPLDDVNSRSIPARDEDVAPYGAEIRLCLPSGCAVIAHQD